MKLTFTTFSPRKRFMQLFQFVLLFLGFGTCMAQMTFQNGKLKGKLPYEQFFEVTGSRQYQDIQADVVLLTITDKDGSVYTGCWWNSLSNPIDDFTFYINQKLTFNREYNFTFTFFNRSSTDPKEIAKIREQVKSQLDAFYQRRRGISDSDIKTTFDKVVKDVYESRPAGSFGRINGDCQFDLSPPTLSGIEYKQYGNYARQRQNLVRANLEIQGIKDKISDLDNNSSYGNITFEIDVVEGLRKLLNQKSNLTARARNLVNYNLSDINDLLQLTKNFTVSKTINKFQELNKSIIPSRLLSNDEIDYIQELVSQNFELSKYQQKRSNAQSRLAELEKTLDALDEFVIQNGFILSGSASSTSTPGEQLTADELDAIRIGTIFGIGNAVLGINPDQDISIENEIFTYTALRVYFGPVDKRLGKDPWLAKGSRVSMFGGIYLSDIKFSGESLGNVAGIKPAFGVGYDLTRYVTLDIGIILGSQTNPNPLSTSVNEVAAPFFALSVDADLLNRFKALGAGESYSKNEK